ncbi:MAG: DUF523 domain-containing protein [Motiliproteus sp.]|nr:DUF523 domain-containing protein [Motiliproteus sp.]
MEFILISSCLLGQQVRYDGKDANYPHPILMRWVEQQRLIPICPEMSGGLPCPRPPAEIQGGQGLQVLEAKSQVLTESGEEVTPQFLRGAQNALGLCQQHDIKMAILKARSPSCGSSSTYDGSFTGKQVKGQGVTAALLMRSGIKVFDESLLVEADVYLTQLEAQISKE